MRLFRSLAVELRKPRWWVLIALLSAAWLLQDLLVGYLAFVFMLLIFAVQDEERSRT